MPLQYCRRPCDACDIPVIPAMSPRYGACGAPPLSIPSRPGSALDDGATIPRESQTNCKRFYSFSGP